MSHLEWIRLILSALLLFCGLFSFVTAVIGNIRFGFAMNRMHSAGIGDTLGLLCVVLSLIIGSGFRMASLKMLLVLVFLWVASPVSTHFLSQVEFLNNDRLGEHLRDEREGGRASGTDDASGEEDA